MTDSPYDAGFAAGRTGSKHEKFLSGFAQDEFDRGYEDGMDTRILENGAEAALEAEAEVDTVVDGFVAFLTAGDWYTGERESVAERLAGLRQWKRRLTSSLSGRVSEAELTMVPRFVADAEREEESLIGMLAELDGREAAAYYEDADNVVQEEVRSRTEEGLYDIGEDDGTPLYAAARAVVESAQGYDWEKFASLGAQEWVIDQPEQLLAHRELRYRAAFEYAMDKTAVLANPEQRQQVVEAFLTVAAPEDELPPEIVDEEPVIDPGAEPPADGALDVDVPPEVEDEGGMMDAGPAGEETPAATFTDAVDATQEAVDQLQDVQDKLQQLIGARSDYEHWNEDADRVWWEEEGRHVEEPDFDPDAVDDRAMQAEDQYYDKLYSAVDAANEMIDVQGMSPEDAAANAADMYGVEVEDVLEEGDFRTLAAKEAYGLPEGWGQSAEDTVCPGCGRRVQEGEDECPVCGANTKDYYRPQSSRFEAKIVQGRDYEEWIEQVEAALDAIVGMGVDDLPDQSWYDWFEDGMSPSAAAKKAIKNEGGADVFARRATTDVAQPGGGAPAAQMPASGVGPGGCPQCGAPMQGEQCPSCGFGVNVARRATAEFDQGYEQGFEYGLDWESGSLPPEPSEGEFGRGFNAGVVAGISRRGIDTVVAYRRENRTADVRSSVREGSRRYLADAAHSEFDQILRDVSDAELETFAEEYGLQMASAEPTDEDIYTAVAAHVWETRASRDVRGVADIQSQIRDWKNKLVTATDAGDTEGEDEALNELTKLQAALQRLQGSKKKSRLPWRRKSD